MEGVAICTLQARYEDEGGETKDGNSYGPGLNLRFCKHDRTERGHFVEVVAIRLGNQRTETDVMDSAKAMPLYQPIRVKLAMRQSFGKVKYEYLGWDPVEQQQPKRAA